MEIIIIIGLIGVVCYVLGSFLENIGKNAEENKRNEIRKEEEQRARTIQPIMDELLEEKKKEYDYIVGKEEYKKNDVLVKRVKSVEVWVNSLNSYSWAWDIDIWSNEQNLCMVTSFDCIKSFVDFQKNFIAQVKSQSLSADTIRKQFENDKRTFIYNTFIPIEKIEYFSSEGDKYTSTSVYGGGGTVGGSSTKGAIVGGILGGEAGAVIGSRKESVINEIKSTTKVHDEKITIIKYRNKEGMLKEIKIARGHEGVFDALKELIPEKEYTYLLQKAQTQNSMDGGNNIQNKLERIKDLYEKESISKEEYDEMRKSILESIL